MNKLKNKRLEVAQKRVEDQNEIFITELQTKLKEKEDRI
jgi:hypothetical protein